MRNSGDRTGRKSQEESHEKKKGMVRGRDIRSIDDTVRGNDDAGIQQRGARIPVRYKSKPNWIDQEEEALQDENTRRILRQLEGKNCPSRAWTVGKMRKEFARYGKIENNDGHMPVLREDEDPADRGSGAGGPHGDRKLRLPRGKNRKAGKTCVRTAR